MPANFYITPAELNKFFKQVDSYTVAVQNKAKKEVARTTYAIHAKAVQSAPRKTSRLVTSIQPKIINGGVTGEVRVGVKYGAYQEFGTGKLVRVPSGYQNLAMKFKGKGIREVNIKPHPYLIPAINSEIPVFTRNIKEIFK